MKNVVLMISILFGFMSLSVEANTYELSCHKPIFRCRNLDSYPYAPLSYFSLRFNSSSLRASVEGVGIGRVDLSSDSINFYYGNNSVPSIVVNQDRDGFFYGQASDRKENLSRNGFSAFDYCWIKCSLEQQ